ncbi:MAG: ISAzo13 family transposase [Deltaproteobacteria bacterium]|nr:ISAzo13 family transposase [Deltaproteobacteria bacterium]
MPIPLEAIRKRYDLLSSILDERTRRLWAAAEAIVCGHGGVTATSRATGISRRAITEGCKELREAKPSPVPSAVRRPGGGRKRLEEKYPDIREKLESLVEPVTRGDPESSLRWTCKSVRVLAHELKKMGIQVSHVAVASLLKDMGYSLQANQKVKEGSFHPDRDAQFTYIYEQVEIFQKDHQPIISVDTKKKELVGDFKNAGRQWRPKGEPERVRVHDFALESGKVAPYGVYDLTENTGWVNLGTDHDTSVFAVESIRRWWQKMGKEADSGGSNGYRVRLWKKELQNLVDETGLIITVCHFPPGTSKWNKIEHRLFSFITMNWRGRPLISHEVIINLIASNLIASTRTKSGLRVQCELDLNKYPKGLKVTDQDMKKLQITPHKFHGEWNYTISPRG